MTLQPSQDSLLQRMTSEQVQKHTSSVNVLVLIPGSEEVCQVHKARKGWSHREHKASTQEERRTGQDAKRPIS